MVNLLSRAAVVLSAALALVSCGGGGTVMTGVTPRTLSAEMASRNAVNYAPYRTSLKRRRQGDRGHHRSHDQTGP